MSLLSFTVTLLISISNIATCLYRTCKSETDLTAGKVEIADVVVFGYRYRKTPILSFKVISDSHWVRIQQCLLPVAIGNPTRFQI